jgi:hypothetical protein
MKQILIPENLSKKKREKQQQKTAPASAAYAPIIHGKYMQFLSP